MKRSHLLSIASAVAVLLFVLTVTFTLSNNRFRASALSTPQSVPEHVLSMPYYSVKGGWESVLTLNNAAEDPLSVSLKVYSLDGTPLSLPEQGLNPLQNVSLRLSELLAQADPSGKFKEGSLELRFRHGSGMALGPQLTVTNPSKGWSFDTEPMMGQKSSRLEGLWWSLDQEMGARVALSNTLDQPLNVHVNIDSEGKQTPYPLARLNAHQTVVLNVQDVLKEVGGRAETIGQGGLSVDYDGPVGALIAHGFVLSNKRRFASNLHLVDPAGQPTSLLDGTGLPLGRPAAASAPGAFFTPTLFLRNTTSQPQTATVAAQYTVDGQLKTETLPIVNLKPHQVRAVSFSALANSLRGTAVADAGVRVESSGAPGAVIGQLISLGEQGTCVDVPLLSVELKGSRSGAHPFNLDENSRSVLHLKNLGSKVTRAIVKILYEGGGDYTMELVKILPGQSLAIDLQALKEANKPDIHGHLFPSDLTSGQVTWSQHGEQVILGRLVRSGPSGGGAANFSCGGLCSCGAVYDYAEASPSFIEGEPGDYRGPIGIQEYDYYEACPWRSNNHEGPFTVDAQFEPGDITVADVDIYGSTVQLGDAGETTITGRWVTVVHNTLSGDCAEGNCETSCQPEESLVSLGIPVIVKPKITGISPERGPVGTSLTVTISGKGFRSGATVSAGSGITTSVTSASSTSLEVTFTIDANAAAGNHSVSVTVRGKQSNTVNFFVQVPTSLRLLSQAVSSAYGSGTLANGCPATARPGLAGGTAGPFGMIVRLSYQVMDQQNPAQPIQATMPLRESLINFMADGSPAGGDNVNTLVNPSGATESDGTFVDDPVGGCATGSFNQASFTQKLYMSTDLTLLVRTNDWRFTGRSGCGSITNSSDVSVSVPCQ
jgi:hypothetical protein